MDKRVPFLTFEEFEDLFDETNAIEYRYELLQKILEVVHAVAVQHALLAFPETIIKLLQNITTMQGERDDFLKTNKHVLQHPKEFSRAMAEIEEEQPGVGYKALLKAAADRTQIYVTEKRTISDPAPKPIQEQLGAKLQEVLNGPESDSGHDRPNYSQGRALVGPATFSGPTTNRGPAKSKRVQSAMRELGPEDTVFAANVDKDE